MDPHIENDVSLKKHNTFGLDVKASQFFSFETVEELDRFMLEYSGPLDEVFILGGGSNVLFRSDFRGLIIHSRILTINTVKEDKEYIELEAGSGIVWDDFVQYCIDRKLYGAENMSLIPGNIGATAVQNAGAYGAEAKDLIVEVKAYDLKERKQITLSNADCQFAYRNSVFKTPDFQNRILITSIVYRLSKKSKYYFNVKSQKGNYVTKRLRFWAGFIQHLSKTFRLSKGKGLRSFLDFRFLKNLLEDSGLFPLRMKRKIVIRTRTSKLPDIDKLGNVGSFFKNPIIPEEQANQIKSEYPSTILFPYRPGFQKISAAWLIDQCGWSGKKIGDAGTLKHLPLTIVNYGNATSEDILQLADKIETDVMSKFGVKLEKEVVVV